MLFSMEQNRLDLSLIPRVNNSEMSLQMRLTQEQASGADIQLPPVLIIACGYLPYAYTPPPIQLAMNEKRSGAGFRHYYFTSYRKSETIKLQKAPYFGIGVGDRICIDAITDPPLADVHTKYSPETLESAQARAMRSRLVISDAQGKPKEIGEQVHISADKSPSHVPITRWVYRITEDDMLAGVIKLPTLVFEAPEHIPCEFTPPPIQLDEKFWRNGIYGKGARYPSYSHVYRFSDKIVLKQIADIGQGDTNDLKIEVNAVPSGITMISATTNFSAATLKVVNYIYDAKTQKGKISVDISGRDFQDARNWIVTNIGKICSDKELLLEAGQETHTGGKYRVLNESTKDGILTIDFSAGYGE